MSLVLDVRTFILVLVLVAVAAGCAERGPAPSGDEVPVEATLSAEVVPGPARGPYRYGIPLPAALPPEAWLANATVQGGTAEVEETARGPMLFVNAVGPSSVETRGAWNASDVSFDWTVPGNFTVLATDRLSSLEAAWTAEAAGCRTDGSARGEDLHGWHDLDALESVSCA